MKLEVHGNVAKSNIKTKSKKFGIADNGVIIDILRNRLYENKVQTSVQEYICNARDAQREVKKPEHDFIVTCPSASNPNFKVRDFGPGVSPSRIENVFILYGASTKRSSNKQTGGFGIGAKSAWSYTDSFLIITFIDGKKRTYVAQIGSDQIGSLDLISTGKTTEKNGTEIQFAINRSDIGEFRDAILRAIQFWPKRPKIVGNEHCNLIELNIDLKHKNLGILNTMLPDYVGLECDNNALIIDGIPYPISSTMLEKCEALKKLTNILRNNVCLYIKNGVVEISASREKIENNAKNANVLNTLSLEILNKIKTDINKQMSKAKTPFQHFEKYFELDEKYNMSEFNSYGDYSVSNDKLTHKDLDKVKITICTTQDGDKINKEVMGESKSSYGLRHVKAHGLTKNQFNSLFFLDVKESIIKQNKRIREYLAQIGTTQLLLVERIDGNGSIFQTFKGELSFKKSSTLKYREATKAVTEKRQIDKEKICLHIILSCHGKNTKYINLNDNTQKYLYVPINKGVFEGFDLEFIKEMHNYLRNIDSTYKVCGIAKSQLNRIDENKNFRLLTEYLDNYKPTKKELNYVKFVKRKYRNDEAMDLLKGVTGINDKFLFIMAKTYIDMYERSQNVPHIIFNKLIEHAIVKKFIKDDTKLTKEIDSKYPLLRVIDKYGMKRKQVNQELVCYINAKGE